MSKVIFYVMISVVLSATLITPLNADERTIPLLEGEKFWGGCVTDGSAMPFGATAYERDLLGDTRGNQAQPLLISDKGRYVWCEEPFVFNFDDGNLFIRSQAGAIMFGKAGDSLREAYQHVSRTYFPSAGELPDEKTNAAGRTSQSGGTAIAHRST